MCLSTSYVIVTLVTMILYQQIGCHPTPALQHHAKSLELLRHFNLSTLILATHDARIGNAIASYLNDRRNRTILRRRKNKRNSTMTQHVSKNDAESSDDTEDSEDDEDYEDYDEDYSDFDFTPAAIFIYVLELFGTLIGLSWGAIATIFSSG